MPANHRLTWGRAGVGARARARSRARARNRATGLTFVSVELTFVSLCGVSKQPQPASTESVELPIARLGPAARVVLTPSNVRRCEVHAARRVSHAHIRVRGGYIATAGLGTRVSTDGVEVGAGHGGGLGTFQGEVVAWAATLPVGTNTQSNLLPLGVAGSSVQFSFIKTLINYDGSEFVFIRKMECIFDKFRDVKVK